MDTLTQYTTPKIPAANPWITAGSATPPPPPPPQPAGAGKRGKRRPPSRRLIRHVLRARAEAASALSSFLKQLEQSGETKRIRASAHLARTYGTLDQPTEHETSEGFAPALEPGWRDAREVVRFLRARGAKIADLDHRIEGDWAALSSEGEGEGDVDSDVVEEVMWVPPGRSNTSVQ